MKYSTTLTDDNLQKALVNWVKERKCISISFFSRDNKVVTVLGFQSYPQVMKFKECLKDLRFKLLDSSGKIELIDEERLREHFEIANPDVMKFIFTWDITVEDLLKGL